MGSKRQRHRDKVERQQRRSLMTWSGRPIDDVGTTIGWAAARTDLPRVRQMTHDQLITMMGDERDGPVSWFIPDDVARALELLDQMDTPHNASEGHRAPSEAQAAANAAAYNEVRTLLCDEGGYLVVASAPASRTDG